MTKAESKSEKRTARSTAARTLAATMGDGPKRAATRVVLARNLVEHVGGRWRLTPLGSRVLDGLQRVRDA